MYRVQRDSHAVKPEYNDQFSSWSTAAAIARALRRAASPYRPSPKWR
jgi:hypothetical protein